MSSSLTRLKRGRAIHLLDPENLCGSSLLTEAMVAEMRGLYTSAVSVGPQDHIILASAHCSLLPMADGWPMPGTRFVQAKMALTSASPTSCSTRTWLIGSTMSLSPPAMAVLLLLLQI